MNNKTYKKMQLGGYDYTPARIIRKKLKRQLSINDFNSNDQFVMYDPRQIASDFLQARSKHEHHKQKAELHKRSMVSSVKALRKVIPAKKYTLLRMRVLDGMSFREMGKELEVSYVKARYMLDEVIQYVRDYSNGSVWDPKDKK